MSATSQNTDGNDRRRDALLVVIAKWLERLDKTLNRIRIALEVIAAGKGGKSRRRK